MIFDDSEQVQAAVLTPRAPPKREGRGIWGSAWDSVKAQGHRGTASLLEALKPFGAAAATTAEADPMLHAVMGSDAVRKGAEEGRRQIATGEAMNFEPNEMSIPSRLMVDALKPDPETATTAERIVFGLTGPMVGLVGGGLLAGPVGLAAASAEMGFSQSEDLRKRDVALGPRSAVGALTATVTAAGGVLPVFGSTAAKTVGLYALGGPVAFVGQQMATRSILENAGYADIAKEFDPLDPTGLALSFAPGAPFLAAGLLRNAKAGKPRVLRRRRPQMSVSIP